MNVNASPANPPLDRRTFLRTAGAALAAGAWAGRMSWAASEADASAGSRVFPLVGRVTDRSGVVHLLSPTDQTVTVRIPAAGPRATRTVALKRNVPTEVELTDLKPATRYDTQIVSKESTTSARIQTQRAAGGEFVFTIQGDSHPERPQMFDATLYQRTLDRIAADTPDFHVCMGDDFSITHLATLSEATVAARYLLQRPYLASVGAPVFLVNGNHEQASLFNYNQDGEPHNAAVWAQQARNRYFPLPSPDRFYTGNAHPLDPIGPLRDYHAWTWGDALFVILDNYWHSPACVDTLLREKDARDQRKGKDRDWWNITIGDAQYDWLARTLEASGAKHKFVFAHHVMGTGRGGIERAAFHEWGGKSGRDRGTFAEHRPTWKHSIHALMVRHGVSIFFQGHDHLYARQELDGVVYQTCPMPADPNYQAHNDQHYTSGIKHPNSGYLRVYVTPTDARVEYIRTYKAADVDATRQHGAVAHAYTVKPRTAS